MHFNSKKNNILKSILFLFSSMHMFSQSDSASKGSEISGKVLNQSHLEVVYASIALIKNDSTLVNSTISTTNGVFKISNVNPGIYMLRIDHIEHETYFTEPFTLLLNEHKIVPNIILNPASNTLDEVVISQKKALIEIKADKLIFNVSSSPSASGTNGLDLLKKSPGVTLDLDNNISLLGKSNVQVYLNGIQSRLSGNDLTNFLQSLTSDVIDSIEIISNPSSKYDAEGTGGIINIRMKKNMATGFNGSETSSFTKGLFYKYSNNLSLNFGGKKIKTNFDFTQSRDNNLEIFDDVSQQNNSILDLYSKENQIRNGYNLGIGLEAQLSENHALNLSARGIFNTNTNTLNSTTDIYQANPYEFLKILNSKSFLDGTSSNYLFNLNHLWNTSKTSTINTNLSLGSYNTQRSTQQPNTYYEPDGATVIENKNSIFDTDTNINLWSAKIDFDKEWGNITFSTGLKYAQIITKNGFNFYNVENDNPVFDITKSNDFNYTENVAAIYANLNMKLSTSLNLNAGIRVENTESRGKLISDIDIDNKDVPRSYTNFFPNVGLSFDFQTNHSWSVSIGRRITRPNYQDLNPFEKPTSQLVIWKGNPFLKPNYIMNYQASYSYKQKLIITTSYSETKDFFAKIIEITGENQSQIIPRNMQLATNFGISSSYPVTVNKIWEIMFFANASQKTYKGNLEGTVIDLKSTLWDYSIQNNLNLPSDILMDVTFSQQSTWIWRGTVFIKGTYGLSFGLRKDFLDKKLQIRITGSDILRTESEYPYYSNYGGINLNGTYINDGRRFGLGATYKFGNQQAKNKSKTKSALDEELNRIGN
jgi:iron complex outermembrane receptor protein